jgi:type VI secretion system VasD/TssJ family lipoprotein
MKTKSILLLSGLLLSLLAAGCAGKGKEVPPYVKDAIEFKVSAVPDLNFANNQSHTVVLVVYELSQPNIFKQMLESSDGVVQLLEGKQFDSSVLSRRRAIVQPGENTSFLMDQVEGARYVAVVAGFYSMQGSSNFSRLYPIELKGGFFWSGSGPRMTIDLRLGRDGIVEAPRPS